MRLACIRACYGGRYRIGSGAVGVVRAGATTETEGDSMKATLEFELPEEQEQFRVAVNGAAWQAVLQNLDQQMRGVVKHGDDAVEAEQAQRWRDVLHDLAEAGGAAIYD
jgi:hypothetical protein